MSLASASPFAQHLRVQLLHRHPLSPLFPFLLALALACGDGSSIATDHSLCFVFAGNFARKALANFCNCVITYTSGGVDFYAAIHLPMQLWVQLTRSLGCFSDAGTNSCSYCGVAVLQSCSAATCNSQAT